MRSLFGLVAFMVTTGFATSIFAQTGAFEHRSQGLISDGFMTADGTRLHLAEDGGRIRYRDPSGAWTYQVVDKFVKDTIHRIHFLETGPNAGTGWAVAQDGHVLKTDNWGINGWQIIETIASQVPGTQYEDLFDVHFLDVDRGWAVGIHGIWYWDSDPLSTGFKPATILDAAGQPIPLASLSLYAIDVVERGESLVALVCGTPGLVFRNTDASGTVFQVVWNAKTMPLGYFGPNTCEQHGVDAGALALWDIEILRSETEAFALMIGGIGDQCGLAFSSTTDGSTWTKESHECQPSGGGTPCTGNSLYENNHSTFTDTWRHQSFKTLYGLGLFADRSAVACGYNGQHVIRDPATGTWLDRSKFSNRPFEAVDPIYFPFYGATAARLGTAGNGKAVLMGVDGLLRGTTDGGATWNHDLVAEQFRTMAVHFVNASIGYYVSQLFRIAKSTNGGLTWTPQQPDGALNTQAFRAITFDPTGRYGVAVGSYDQRMTAAFPDRPKIMHIDDQLTPNFWSDPSTIRIEGDTDWYQKELRAVAWTGDQTFWAVGQSGLVFVSEDAGVNWRQVVDPNQDVSGLQSKHEFEGLAFIDPDHGIFVGWNPGGPGSRAYWYDAGSWTNIAPADPEIRRINDVKILGDTAYAVALKIDSNNFRQGIVLKSDLSGGAFGQFTSLGPISSACKIGSHLGVIPILNRIAVNPANDEIWVGGECGRIWRGEVAGSGTIGWTEHKSQSDAHIFSMSLTPDGYLYLGMSRQSTTQQAIVRWRP